MMDSKVTTILTNLVDVEIIKVNSGEGRKYIRNHRTEENFYDVRSREWVPVLDDEIARFLRAVKEEEQVLVTPDGGTTLRQIALEALDEEYQSLQSALVEEDDDVARLNQYDQIVSAIENTDTFETSEKFGAMGFRNVSNKYALSERATRVIENKSLSEYEED